MARGKERKRERKLFSREPLPHFQAQRHQMMHKRPHADITAIKYWGQKCTIGFFLLGQVIDLVLLYMRSQFLQGL